MPSVPHNRFSLEPPEDQEDEEPCADPIYAFPMEIILCPKCRPMIGDDGSAIIILCPEHAGKKREKKEDQDNGNDVGPGKT